MRVASGQESAAGLETPAPPAAAESTAESAADPVAAPAADPAADPLAGPAPERAAPGEPDGESPGEPDAGRPPAHLAELSAAVRALAGGAERYHDRAAQREGVIDYLRAELETLRRGERRGMVRPLLTEMCRLRNDLLKQAATLPADYDARQAAALLASFAETVDLALENNGVVRYAPEPGDSFDPRRHRRLRGAATDDPARSGRIAQVLRDGYLDSEANSPVVPAEVTVFLAVKDSK